MTARDTHDARRKPGRSLTGTGGLDQERAGSATGAGPGAKPPIDDAPELVWLDGEGLEQFAMKGPRSSSRDDDPAAAASLGGDPSSTAVEGGFQEPVIAEEFGRYFKERERSRLEWVQSVSRAALLCVIAAAGADWFFGSPPPDVAARRASAPPAAARVAVAPRPVAPRPAVTRAPEALDAINPAPPRTVAISTSARTTVVQTPPKPSPVVAAIPRDARSTIARASEARPSPAAPPAAAGTLGAEIPPPPVTPTTVVDDPPVVLPAPETRVASAPAPAAPREAPATAVVPPPTRELEARAIENVLGRYRTAFNELNAGAASAVWPSVNQKNLAKAFDRLEDQNVSFDHCQIEVIASLAEAACNGSARYVPKVGSRTPKAESRRWTFSLRKGGTGWLIDRVDAR